MPSSFPYGLVTVESPTSPLTIYGSGVGTVLNRDSLTPKFLAKIDLGVCVIQSSTPNVVLRLFLACGVLPNQSLALPDFIEIPYRAR